MFNYAAHDSHFLLYLAFELQEEFRKKKSDEDLGNFLQDLQVKVLEIQYAPREDQFDPTSYRLVFRKILDGYDPESEAFLLTDYVFKALYYLRENLSQ